MAQTETSYILSVGIPVLTFVLGFITSRFTLSKKDRLDHQQVLFQNERDLSEKHQAAYDEFQKALKAYINSSSPGIDEFSLISNSGDNYFRRLREIGEAVLSGNVREVASRETFVPLLRNAVETSLPSYYRSLQDIAANKELEYHGELERKNYEPIYAAVEKFSGL